MYSDVFWLLMFLGAVKHVSEEKDEMNQIQSLMYHVLMYALLKVFIIEMNLYNFIYPLSPERESAPHWNTIALDW